MIAERTHFTIPEMAKELGEPDWLVRRTVDALGLPIARAGRSLYRLIPVELLERVRQEIQRRRTAGRVREKAAS
jgi:phage portal protein BeeE